MHADLVAAARKHRGPMTASHIAIAAGRASTAGLHDDLRAAVVAGDLVLDATGQLARWTAK